MHIQMHVNDVIEEYSFGYTRPGLLPDVTSVTWQSVWSSEWYVLIDAQPTNQFITWAPSHTPVRPLKYSTAAMRREHLLNTRRSTYLVLEAGAVIAFRSSPYLLLPGPWAAFSRSQCFWQRSIDRSSCVFSSLLLPPVRLELLSGCLSRLQWGGWATCAPCSRSNSVSLCLSVFRTLLSLSLSPSHKHTCTLSLCLPPSPSDSPRSRSFSFSYPHYASLPPVLFSLSPIVLICQRWRSPPAASRGCSNSRQ